jgi:hypothetical protein
MSKMSDLILDLQEAIAEGYLGFADIARKFEVPLSWVVEAAEMMGEYEGEDL